MSKKLRILPLLLSLSLLAGCTDREEEKEVRDTPTTPAVKATAAPTTPPTVEPVVEEHDPKVYVNYKEERKDYLAEGSNALLLSYSCRTPQLTLPGREETARNINEELKARSALFKSGADDSEGDGLNNLLSIVASDYAAHLSEGTADSFTPYAYERDGSTVRGDARMVSFLFSCYVNSGGAHPNTSWSGLCFDGESGMPLHFSDLADNEEALKKLCRDAIKSQCDERKDALFEDYSAHIDELFSDGLWYFNDSGLVFIANPYHLAPYAAGVLSFTVRYKTLKGTISDRFLLPERNPVQGGIEASRMADEPKAEPDYSLILNKVGEQVLLRSVNSVYNVRLFTVDYEEESGSFRQKEEMLYLSALHDGECVMVQTDIPDALPRLQLSWRLPDGTAQRYLLSQSGRDGSILLLEPNTLSRQQPGEVENNSLYWDLDGDGDCEQLYLTKEENWVISVWDEEEKVLTTPYTAESLRLFVADVDEDNLCEIFVQNDKILRCWRYDGKLSPVSFRVRGEMQEELEGQLLSADYDGANIRTNLRFGKSTLSAQALFRDGPDGSLALAYGSSWVFPEGGELVLSEDLSYKGADGSVSKLPAGLSITPISMDDTLLTFTLKNGLTATAEIGGLQ